VANHISHLDPPLISMLCPRVVHFMAMAELYSNRLVAWWLKAVKTIPTDRKKADTKALRVAVARLKEENLVAIFPEGGLRAGSDSVLGGKPLGLGGALISAMAQSPVVPCLIVGADQFYDPELRWKRPRVFIRFGPMIETSRDRNGMNTAIQDSLRSMYAEWMASDRFDPVMVAQTGAERMSKKEEPVK